MNKGIACFFAAMIMAIALVTYCNRNSIEQTSQDHQGYSERDMLRDLDEDTNKSKQE